MEEKTIDETIEQIKRQIKEISDKANEETIFQERAQHIKDKTLEALEKAIAKLNEIRNEKLNPDELKEILTFVENKANGLTNRAKESLENLKNKQINKYGVTIGDYAYATMEKISEVCGNAIKSTKEYFAREDVQEKFQNIKDTTKYLISNTISEVKKLFKK